MIYHVASKSTWEEALIKGIYESDSLFSEGFIHTSTLAQVTGVLERYYHDVPDLILLHIDESLLNSPLKYELAPSVNEMFPHIFGPINLNAVVKTERL